MGLLLDTNVISELRRGPRCDSNVALWQDQISEPVFISVITLLEIRKGIQRVRRNDQVFAEKLEVWYQQKVKLRFEGAVLPVDALVAERCAELDGLRTRPYGDALIAATALIHNLTVVTRNTADFEGCGLKLVNPWLFE